MSEMPEGYTSVQCHATSKASGQRCGHRAIPGSTVCRVHGGGTAATRRKARLKLLELVDPAVATIARVMSDPNAKPADRLRAAENVLDRAGLPRKVETTDTEAAKALLIERLLSLRDAAPPADHHQTVQGSVVEPAAITQKEIDK